MWRWRLLKHIVVDVLIVSVLGWASGKYSSYNNNSSRSYPPKVYQTEQVQKIERQVEEYERVPYKFTVDDLSSVYKGSYNRRAATIVFSNIEFSVDKDTLFFNFHMPLLNENITLDMYEGSGYIISNEELIVLNRNRDDEILTGTALKIYSEKYSDGNEDGYLFFSINDQGEQLHFIDKKLGDEFR